MPPSKQILMMAITTVVIVYAIRYLRTSNPSVGMLFPATATTVGLTNQPAQQVIQ